MKDRSLMINTLAPIIVSHASFKMVQMIFQKWLHSNLVFIKKLQILRSLDHLILFKFHQLVVNIVRNYIEYFELLLLAIAMETWKRLEAKICVKCWCSNRVIYFTVANADIGDLRFRNKCLCQRTYKKTSIFQCSKNYSKLTHVT